MEPGSHSTNLAKYENGALQGAISTVTKYAKGHSFVRYNLE